MASLEDDQNKAGSELFRLLHNRSGPTFHPRAADAP
jgi:hypothetical protein